MRLFPLLFALLVLPSPALAASVGFEGTVGDVCSGLFCQGSLVGAFSGIEPTEGSKMLYLSTGPGDRGGDLVADSALFYLNPWLIESGTTSILMDVNLLTGDPVFNDQASIRFRDGYPVIVNITSPSEIIGCHGSATCGSQSFTAISATAPDGSQFTRQTGFFTIEFSVADIAGLAATDFQFLVVDSIGFGGDTAILVDNIRSLPVPEPGTSVLLGIGLWALGAQGNSRNQVINGSVFYD